MRTNLIIPAGIYSLTITVYGIISPLERLMKYDKRTINAKKVYCKTNRCKKLYK
jgi:hypothetical protein